jgi:SAM-dependent methyltransferase
MKNATNEAQSTETSQKGEACPQCGSSSAPFRSSIDMNNMTTREVFHYHRCSGCGLVFMTNIPTDMAPYYRKGYQSIPGSVADLRKLAARERFRLRELLKVKSQGKLLEIGPWIGIFSINAKDAGFEVEAMESDGACVDFLSHTVGIKVFQSNNPADTLANLPERYDAIVLWHSLEHLPTPWLVIESASRALKPGGVLLIAIPNIDSYDSRVMRENWVHLDAPRHLYFYSPEALSALCLRFGMSPLHISTSDRLSLILGLQAWYRYLRRCQPFEYLRGIAGMIEDRIGWRNSRSKHSIGSGLTAIFVKSGAMGSSAA